MHGAQRRSVQDALVRAGLSGHRPDQTVHQDRHPAGVWPGVGCRHHRHCNGTEHGAIRQDSAQCRRTACVPAGHDDLQGDDALRCAQPRVRRGLYEHLLDAQGRSSLRALLPAARLHGRPWLRHRRTGARRSAHGARAGHGHELGLCPAGDREVPARWDQRPMGVQARLRNGRRAAAGGPGRGRRVEVHARQAGSADVRTKEPQ